ncbi:MAG: DUF3365 domain-containing protein [Planctomycetota bacterium]|nr:DUF3365 domain-containing protein [Planctomycetota bacterium]
MYTTATLICTIWIPFFVNTLVAGEPKSEEPEKPTAITVTEARGRVELLETAYLSSLQSIHRNYFSDNKRLPVPSRVLEDVFYSVDRKHGTKSRWIAVNTPAMNLEHKPKEGFETRAVKALAANNSRFEEVRNDVFYSARAVTLFASCQRCHLNALARENAGRRVAGLVIQIPLKSDRPSTGNK